MSLFIVVLSIVVQRKLNQNILIVCTVLERSSISGVLLSDQSPSEVYKKISLKAILSIEEVTSFSLLPSPFPEGT